MKFTTTVIMKQIKFLIIAVSLMSLGSFDVKAATVLSTEKLPSGVRKVIIPKDDGSTLESFELSDKKSCGWYPARLDSASNRWILTQAGENALEAKRDYIRDLHLRWAYEEQRENE